MTIIARYLELVAEAAAEFNLPLPARRAVDKMADEAIRNSGSYYRFHHDFETFCEASLPDVGTDIYSRHPTCEPLMLAYGLNDNPVRQWVPAEGEAQPPELREIMADKRAIKIAWNKPFEWAIWANALGIETPHEQWRDPMVLSFSLSLPGSLEKAGEVVGLSEEKQKLKDGKALVRKFCIPRKPTKTKPHTRVLPEHEPEDWERFKFYNRNDVEAERGILKKLLKFDMSRQEWRLWVLDQKINQAGIPINMTLVENAIAVYEDMFDKHITRMRSITGLDNPNSNKQLLEWLKERGYPFDDVQKGHIERAHDRLKERTKADDFESFEESEMAADTMSVLESRRIVASASPKKFYALRRAVDQSGPVPVLRNAFQFVGAGRTGRWAGRLFQAQNLPRPAKALEDGMATHVNVLTHQPFDIIDILYDKPMDLLKSCIRPAAQAPEGMTFVDADLNAIENRVLGWVAMCKKILRVFEQGRCPYVDFATYLFGGTYEELWHEYKVEKNSFKRTIAKPGVLGCGYMLSAGRVEYNRKTGEAEASGLLGYAWNMGVRDFTEEQAKLSVDTFRREFEEVKDFWYAIERAAIACVRSGQPQKCSFIWFEYDAPFLRMILPSGRPLSYCRPRVAERMTPWGKKKLGLSYEGLNDKNHWGEIHTHGGKLTENAVQAIARDLLAHGLELAHQAGLDIRLHVHDQIVALALAGQQDRALEILIECMRAQPGWAVGLPLGAEGHTSPLFLKG